MNKISFQRLIESLEQFLKENNFPLLSKFESGIASDRIEPRNFNGVLPEELKILYRWRNGIKREFTTDLIGRLELFSGGIPMDIEKVWWIQDTMGGNDIGWSRTKLPIFESGGGDFYLLNCDSTVPIFGQIIYYSPSAVDFELTISIYDSLFTLFQTTYEAYKKGIYSMNDEAMLQVDHSRLGKLADELNPISGYWKLYR